MWLCFLPVRAMALSLSQTAGSDPGGRRGRLTEIKMYPPDWTTLSFKVSLLLRKVLALNTPDTQACNRPWGSAPQGCEGACRKGVTTSLPACTEAARLVALLLHTSPRGPCTAESSTFQLHAAVPASQALASFPFLISIT